MTTPYIQRTRIIAAILITVMLILAGCSPGKPTGANPADPPAVIEQNHTIENDHSRIEDKPAVTISRLELIPSELTLSPNVPGQDQRFANVTVTAHKTDGTEEDITRIEQLVFTSGDSEIAVVDSEGRVSITETAKTGDHTVIRVEYEGRTAECAVIVKYSLEETVTTNAEGVSLVTNLADHAVVVNKQRSLPADYVPNDLIQPDVPFSFAGKSEKKLMREQAARALEQLFKKAEADGIQLYAVSGYRSYSTQKIIFDYNVQTQGEEEARRFSAHPGQSEHQTGLAMDISSPSIHFALEEAFGDTEEGRWLADHAPDFGFIIRYPEGKEAITGYAYEPWHIRYVGLRIARELTEKQMTLEQYFESGFPVLKQENR
jgi:D-alanyl-D-alanine carboxypeptidase